jgi:pantoate ligase/cytidylate kinase
MSSRNRRLSLKQRAFAPYVYKALLAAQQSIACGERYAAVIKCRAAAAPQHAAEIKLEYLELVDPETIRPMDVVKGACAGCIGCLDRRNPTYRQRFL